jgi:hypothetical protein
MTPQDIINQARHITNDADTAPSIARQTNDELVSYVNEGIKEAVFIRPDLFSTVGDMVCVADHCEQCITFMDAVQLLDVLCIHDGRALTPFDRSSMDLFRPGWRMDPAGQAENWSPLNGDPLKFFVYPKAPPGQVLDVRYVRNPAVYALNDTIGDLPESFLPALADYVVYRTESKDDEHVLTQRAAAHYAAFKSKFGAANGATVSQ